MFRYDENINELLQTLALKGFPILVVFAKTPKVFSDFVQPRGGRKAKLKLTENPFLLRLWGATCGKLGIPWRFGETGKIEVLTFFRESFITSTNTY